MRHINEDFFDDNKLDIENKPEDIEEVPVEYAYHMRFTIGLSNEAIANEALFTKAIGHLEHRLTSAFDAFSFIGEYSKFKYTQHLQNKESRDLREFEYGGFTVYCDTKSFKNREYISDLDIEVDLNLNFKNAAQCLRFIRMFGRDKLTNEYSFLKEWLVIEKTESIDNFELEMNRYEDYKSFLDYSEPLYNLCVLVFDEDYTYGDMLTQLKTTNVESIVYTFYDNGEEDDEKITKIGHYDRIGNASDKSCPAFNKSPYTGDGLYVFNIDGSIADHFSDPWMAPNILNKYGDYLTSHGATIYVVNPTNDTIDDLLLVIFDGTFKDFNGTEYVLVFQVENDLIKARQVMSCFMPLKEADAIASKHFYLTDDEDEEWDDDEED